MKLVTREMFIWKSKNDALWIQFYLPSVRLVGPDLSFKVDFRFRISLKPVLFAFAIGGFGLGFDYNPASSKQKQPCEG